MIASKKNRSYSTNVIKLLLLLSYHHIIIINVAIVVFTDIVNINVKIITVHPNLLLTHGINTYLIIPHLASTVK